MDNVFGIPELTRHSRTRMWSLKNPMIGLRLNIDVSWSVEAKITYDLHCAHAGCWAKAVLARAALLRRRLLTPIFLIVRNEGEVSCQMKGAKKNGIPSGSFYTMPPIVACVRGPKKDRRRSI